MLNVKLYRVGLIFLSVILAVFMSVAETGEADSFEEPGSASAEEVSSPETGEKISGDSEEVSAGVQEDGSETETGSASAEEVSSPETGEKISGDSEEMSAGVEEEGSEAGTSSAATETSTSGRELETRTIDGYTIEELQGKLRSYTRMKKGGTILLSSGISLLCVGAVMFPAGIANSSSVAPIFIGFYSIVFGIPLTVAGGVVTGIGSKKKRQYENMLQVRISPGSLELVYSF